MPLSTDDCLTAIARHSAGLASAARDRLTEPVEHCPGWSVADLVEHLTGVHWFWATIAEERPDSPPEQSRRPARAEDADLLDVFEVGAARLVQVLRSADQSAACWTWAPQAQNVAFITRHQVQEAAVHQWDAAHAGGGGWEMDPAVAADCVDEFLTYSVSSDADHEDPPGGPLAGAFVLRSSDTGDAWTIADGDLPGTARISSGTSDAPVVEATAADLLLWLYGRTDLDTSSVPGDLLARFRALTFTD
jgi:uncharacterized protein (TIGR03083 family)